MSCAALASARAACVAPLSRAALSRGRRHFRSRRALAASAAAETSPASGTQKVCVITGANTGLGFISAREIAAKGHVVVLAVRDTDKGAKAAADIERALGESGAPASSGALDVMRLDLQDLQSIDSFVDEFSAKYDRCDVLMNNAGVMALPQKSLTVNGIETQMGTNHMGHFYLTEKMMPKSSRRAGGRESSTCPPSRTSGAILTSRTPTRTAYSGTSPPDGSPTAARNSPTCTSRTSCIGVCVVSAATARASTSTPCIPGSWTPSSRGRLTLTSTRS
jgi:NAD(P)-dependent dehydrogenase (short-subunit alcohol dehydrogenase family)